MPDFNVERYNKILGWVAFAIALTVYSLTLEPTASFWDAGEYISTASKLEIGHPPGAPLYQMMGAFFSSFAPDNTYIAFAVNYMSALASAFAILFMFWSITRLLRNLLKQNNEKATPVKQQAILASAFIASLAFAFTDSFWFSAVEAEVYGMALFLMSALFYIGLLWDRDMHKPRGNRWLILMSFIIGLSFGVHFMALLTIPAIGFLYYFKNVKKITWQNFVIANIIVVAILMFIFKLLLPYTLAFFGHLEVFFVNEIGLPFNSGTIIAGLIIIAAFYYIITLSRKRNLPHINTISLCVLYVLIGFSSWLMLPIRANAGTTINENNPNNARELLAYYNREQYPETKLFYGPQFSADYTGLDPETPYVDDKKKYEQNHKTKKYEVVNQWRNAKQNLDDAQKVFLPRMWSSENALNYLKYTGPLQFSIKQELLGDPDIKYLQDIVSQFRRDYNAGKIDLEGYHQFLKQFGNYFDIEPPSMAANMNYMFSFQFSYMYWRYFMWNFAGRQDDIQGTGDILHGNWLSGIDFIDELRLDSQDALTTDALNNKARNTYFFIPLLIGLLGLLFQIKKDQRNFWVLLVFFLFTGIALKIYLNERAFEPRERDYALVGSFYVFAIWIGFGVYALFDALSEFVSRKVALPIATILCLLGAPVLLISQNWDDHDRSGRKTALAMARKYLDSVDENAILFTIGDNDTFALWYVQEIEGYRTDVRVINTSLLNTDWYMDQMKRKAYKSDAVPSQLTHDKYRYGTRDFIWYKETAKDTMDITQWFNWVASEDPRTKEELNSGQIVNTFPAKNIIIPVNKEAALKNGTVRIEDTDKIVDKITISLGGDVLYKNRILMLDILTNNNWERPIYFTGGSFGNDDYLWMKDYLQLDGVCYRLVPIKTPVNPENPYDMGRIDSEKMYNIVKNWYWGNSGNPEIYHDRETRTNGITYRGNIARLVEQLLNEGKTAKAKEMLDLAMEKMPVDTFEFYSLVEPYISGYYAIGEKETARKIWNQLAKVHQEKLTYFSTLKLENQYEYGEEIITAVEQYRNLLDMLVINEEEGEKLIPEKAREFNNYLMLFEFFGDDNTEDLSPSDTPLDPNESGIDAGFSIPLDSTDPN